MKQGTSYWPRADDGDRKQDTAYPATPTSIPQEAAHRYEAANGEIKLTPKDLQGREKITSVELPITQARNPIFPLSHQHSPPWNEFIRIGSPAPLRPQSDQGAADLAASARRRQLLNDLAKPRGLTKRQSLETHHNATPTREYAHRAELSGGVGPEDIDNGGCVNELNTIEEVAACFGYDHARFALNALEKIASDDPFSLLRIELVFRQCPSSSESSGGAPSNGTTADLSIPSKSSPGSDERKTPLGDGGDPEKDENDEGGDDGGGPSKRVKSGSEAQLRWDCPFDRVPSGAAGNAAGCAKAGLLFNDLWFVVICP
ncbi:uncharacterized protein A1O5_03252 [Cladophialophora psammophila CBS 110553]|uniref:Uncharacterized protein n=1 Tax=Cladophialophora psammophila CBS 110553 TaxID=1182543 RepID=W9X986_9EURO|nr:uncharacterized protein A1O5_03252 [Cladophialophora psammophila CBS 110553]EXJ73491.1 hypothetical protein A1O5_03252 [Cladophialophora psammophila CBS 110553]